MEIIVWLVSPQHEEHIKGLWRQEGGSIVLEMPITQVGLLRIHRAQAVLEFWQSSVCLSSVGFIGTSHQASV